MTLRRPLFAKYAILITALAGRRELDAFAEHLDVIVFTLVLPRQIRVALARGRQARVRYERGQAPSVASRLQDFFGMREGPRIAAGRVSPFTRVAPVRLRQPPKRGSPPPDTTAWPGGASPAPCARRIGFTCTAVYRSSPRS